MVYQHQRLLLMDTCIAVAKAFPARLVYQPSGRKFHLPVGLRIGGQPGITRTQLVGQGRRYQGVLEKAAGIAEYLRIGQLLAADGADRTADV